MPDGEDWSSNRTAPIQYSGIRHQASLTNGQELVSEHTNIYVAHSSAAVAAIAVGP